MKYKNHEFIHYVLVSVLNGRAGFDPKSQRESDHIDSIQVRVVHVDEGSSSKRGGVFIASRNRFES